MGVTVSMWTRDPQARVGEAAGARREGQALAALGADLGAGWMRGAREKGSQVTPRIQAQGTRAS